MGQCENCKTDVEYGTKFCVTCANKWKVCAICGVMTSDHPYCELDAPTV